MIIYSVFVIFDSKAETYSQPMFMKSKGEFLRAFAEAANDKSCNIGKYPEDFTAFEVGSWSDVTAEFKLNKAHVSLGKALEYVRVVAGAGAAAPASGSPDVGSK